MSRGNPPLLSILMPALQCRRWQDMHDRLMDQSLPLGGEVEVLVELDDGEATSGVKRQRLMDMSRGRYVAFVDDDDEIEPDYLELLVDGCRQDRDVVTFQLDMAIDNKPGREVWTFGLWPNHRKSGKMCVNHLCAWRREIASMVAWCPDLGNADDQLWFQPLFSAGLVKSEHHIPKVLYHYIYRSLSTWNQTISRVRHRREYIGDGLMCFASRSEPREIFIQVGGPRRMISGQNILVRDRRNNEKMINASEHDLFHVIRVE